MAYPGHICFNLCLSGSVVGTSLVPWKGSGRANPGHTCFTPRLSGSFCVVPLWENGVSAPSWEGVDRGCKAYAAETRTMDVTPVVANNFMMTMMMMVDLFAFTSSSGERERGREIKDGCEGQKPCECNDVAGNNAQISSVFPSQPCFQGAVLSLLAYVFPAPSVYLPRDIIVTRHVRT